MRTIQSAGTPSTRIAIGLWHPDTHYGAGLPHPQSLVSPGWEPQRRPQIVEYLRAGHAIRGNGLRFCIFGCRSVAWARTDDPTKGVRKPELDDESEGPPGFWIAIDCCYTTGWVELSDGVWLWPDGLAHDVEAHGVRLPDEFVAYAAARDFRLPKHELSRMTKLSCSTSSGPTGAGRTRASSTSRIASNAADPIRPRTREVVAADPDRSRAPPSADGPPILA